MIEKRLGKLKVFVLIMIITLLSGCSMADKLVFGNAGGGTADDNKITTESKKETPGSISSAEDKVIKKEIVEYFNKLYSGNIDSYQKSNVSGSIHENIKGFIAKRTLEEGNNNPGVGIHYPRFVEINGRTIIGYEVAQKTDNNGTTVPDIEAVYYSSNESSHLYYVKVNLLADCLSYEEFDKAFKMSEDNSYQIPEHIDINLKDRIRVQARYDVEVIKEENTIKILTASETNAKPGNKNRLFKLNNEFLTRLIYLNIERTSDGKKYICEDDGKVYEMEKEVITAFLNNLRTNVDKERMSLINTIWETNDSNRFKSFLEKIGVTRGKDSKEIVSISSDYKKNFNKKDFPLKNNMDRFKEEYKNLNILPHPGYSQKQKRYVVTFDALVDDMKGISGTESIYRYNYFVTLTAESDGIKVSGIKLNEFYKLINQK